MRYFFFYFYIFLALFLGWNKATFADIQGKEEKSKIARFLDFSDNLSLSKTFISDSKTTGNWQINEFGKIRLVSADSGTKDLKYAWMALMVNLNPAVIMKNPTLTLKKGKNIQHIDFLWPISLPLSSEYGLNYHLNATFPFKITLKESNQPLDVEIELSADFCTTECFRHAFYTNLTVLAQRNLLSPFASFISHSLNFTPNILSDGQVQTGCLSKDTFWIKINLPEKITETTILLLNSKTNEPINYETINSIKAGKDALFILKTQEKIQDESILIFIQNQKSVWQTRQTLLGQKTPAFTPKKEVKKLPFYWWIFFMIMLPSLVLFIQQSPRHEINSRQTNIKNIIGVSLGTLSGCLIYFVYPYALLSTSLTWLIFGFILFTFLGLFLYPITAFGYGILNAIVPFFAFFENEGLKDPSSFLELFIFFVQLSCIASIPFIFGILLPIFNVRLGKKIRHRKHFSLQFPMWLTAFLFAYLILIRLFH